MTPQLSALISAPDGARRSDDTMDHRRASKHASDRAGRTASLSRREGGGPNGTVSSVGAVHTGHKSGGAVSLVTGQAV
jgi:hypothetical protein